jgi:hypothetical protein
VTRTERGIYTRVSESNPPLGELESGCQLRALI